MPDLDFVRAEIERMRVQVGRQRKDILSPQRAGISTASAELLLGRMLAKIDGLCEQRDQLKKEQPPERRVLGGRKWWLPNGTTSR
ncbi:hypothetical protein [Bradyrhizobium sp. AZCC 1693]|uniref:hypothetical protein n=1 Tax=Bradyrhizobium sp. AZCC 1693 TaxID=3117029 RepID=UPI002FF12634